MDFCPICKKVFLDGEDAVRFAEVPEVPYHATCVARFGVEKTRQVLTSVAASIAVSHEPEDESENDNETE